MLAGCRSLFHDGCIGGGCLEPYMGAGRASANGWTNQSIVHRVVCVDSTQPPVPREAQLAHQHDQGRHSLYLSMGCDARHCLEKLLS